MFGVDSSELLFIAFVALIVIGPKDLPKAMRVVGYWVGRARGVARQFRSGFDQMVREAELEEMEKRWAAENERIMREHPQPAAAGPDVAPADPAGHPTPPAGVYVAPDEVAVPADDTDRPVMVEKPHVEPAPAPPATAPHRPEGASS